MLRVARLLVFLAFCAPVAVCAQESGNAGDEMKVMRQMLEQQSKQIDVLAQEIARLNMLLEGKTAASGPTAESPAPSAEAAAPSAPPKAIPLEDQAAGAKPAPSAPTGPTHIVAKGETLTAIAKHYKVTVSELLKVNKIADVRKLQIGQSVNLPPDAKMPASTPSSSPQPQ